MSKITFIGSGRAATALGRSLAEARHEFKQVWSRTELSANDLAAKLHAAATTDLNDITSDADIYIIAVKDDAISDVAAKLHIGNKIIVHTSGIKSKDTLQLASQNYGIFYPFLSMTKEAGADFRNALMMIEGSNPETVDILKSLARSISSHVRMVEENQRQSLHLAAVFAHNFTNHMYTISERILADKGLDFNDLRPLIAAHAANIQQLSPSVLQTGPAIRHDSSTIDTHLRLLGQDDTLEQLYLTMTEAIQQWYKEKK
jgi:predicted short-subunit dehydrogenase-like oxidoreductase (DUF2520 family)